MNRILFFVCLLSIGIMSSCGSRKSSVLGSKSPNSIPNTSSNTNKPASANANAYIERYKNIAINEMNRYGIPASIKLGQAILESGMGNSYLALEANNHFGIKCGGVWNGKSVTRPDDNINDCFRVYANAEESFKDHSQFLLRKRYEKLFALRKDDYKAWARGLKDAGYATNPKYPELLIGIIERYDLHRFDRAESYVEKETREEKVEEIIVEKEIEEPAVIPEEIKTPVAMVIYEVKPSDTLYNISKRYNVTVDQLKTWNNLSTENLSVGQLLVVTK
ncbi:glucosaminidase domain-containing protein [Sphingobacterium hungaricum]